MIDSKCYCTYYINEESGGKKDGVRGWKGL